MNTKKFSWLILFILLLLTMPPRERAHTQSLPMITILSPTEGSAVSSPIEISADMYIEDASLLRISLTNGENFEISRQLHRLPSSLEEYYPFSASLTYEIPNESAPARLSLLLKDDQGRPLCMRSVTLNLKSEGFEEIETPAPESVWLTITTPEPKDTISGGEIHITGQIVPLTESPVFFDLYAQNGRILNTGQLAVTQPGKSMAFEVTVPYSIEAIQENSLLVVRQTSAPYQETIILDSLPLTLSP